MFAFGKHRHRRPDNDFTKQTINHPPPMKHIICHWLTLGTLALLISTSFAQDAPIIPARFLPGDRAIRLSARDQVAPEIASGGSTVLAVWQDGRALPANLLIPPAIEWETSYDIYAMRLDANGAPLDRIPLVVTQEAAAQSKPQVSWNGTNWLVVFESVDINGTGFFYAPSLEAVRVAADGTILDPTPIKIRNVSPAGSSWTVASDGNQWVIAFQESDSDSAIALLRVTPVGDVLQGPTVVVPSTYFLRSNFHMAFANGVFLLSWAEFSDTQALRFDSNLGSLFPTTLVSLMLLLRNLLPGTGQTFASPGPLITSFLGLA
jgi:hypothetical protein